MKKRALLFDLDHTLYNADLAYARSINSIPELRKQLSLFQRARSESKNTIGKGHTSSHHRLIYFKRFLETQQSFSPKKLLRIHTQYERQLQKQVLAQWKQLHRSRLIKKLSENYTLAILTNETLRTQLLKMEMIDPSGKWFKTIVTSEEAGVEKPDSKIFRLALDRLGLPPEKCTFVGDDWNTDMIPAHELGMRCIWTQEFHEKSASLPLSHPKISIIQKLDDLPQVLK